MVPTAGPLLCESADLRLDLPDLGDHLVVVLRGDDQLVVADPAVAETVTHGGGKTLEGLADVLLLDGSVLRELRLVDLLLVGTLH